MGAADINFRRYVIDEILSAALELGVDVKELPPDDIEELRGRLADRFGTSGTRITSQNMKDKVAVQNPDAWMRLGEFLTPTPHILFYDSPGEFDRAGVLVEDGSRLADLIGECGGFPFYISDLAESFVVGMNDHDYIIGTEKARPWIESLPPWEPERPTEDDR